MSSAASAALLKLWALEAGFDRAGVAAVRASDHQQAVLDWLELGRHAGMSYLSRRVECRLNAENLVPWARSVLCVALQYATAEDDTEGDLWPWVARYARGRDYHEVVGEGLESLRCRIEEGFPGCTTRWYVDTGPVLERELAARAGLGVVGKNTNLLHPQAGSYFFLGEIFLDLDLEPDIPIADLCGSCTACLEACPTEALVAPFVLDSNLCISYWNIEHRGEVPPASRERAGQWVFGCDVCQEVCPWNASPEPPAASEFEIPPRRRRLGLLELLALSRSSYVEVFRGSAMKRAKLEGLKRNAAIAMGNRGQQRYVPALAEALVREEAQVRGAVAWALGSIGGDRARSVLRKRLPDEEDATVRRELQRALQRCEEGPPGLAFG